MKRVKSEDIHLLLIYSQCGILPEYCYVKLGTCQQMHYSSVADHYRLRGLQVRPLVFTAIVLQNFFIRREHQVCDALPAKLLRDKRSPFLSHTKEFFPIQTRRAA